MSVYGLCATIGIAIGISVMALNSTGYAAATNASPSTILVQVLLGERADAFGWRTAYYKRNRF